MKGNREKVEKMNYKSAFRLPINVFLCIFKNLNVLHVPIVPKVSIASLLCQGVRNTVNKPLCAGGKWNPGL